MIRSVSILGATGSVGTSTLDLIRRNRDEWRVVTLTANCQAKELAALAREFGAELAAVADESCLPELREALAGSGIEAAAGAQALCEAASHGADLTVAAIVGCAGLAPTMAAIEQGGIVALANKEALVSAGEVMTAAVAKYGATLLPVDSEHNAIFQCLQGNDIGTVRWITLTASGGPFRDWTLAQLVAATPAQAVKHPNWDMGAKISVDSATMMNKGLELIEAAYLFDTPVERIDVLIHPQQIIHSLVAYDDGSVLAQLGLPDMRTPIAYALAWPGRMPLPGLQRLDLAKIGRLDFLPPDMERFPALRLSRAAVSAGGGSPIVLNGANEVAVAAFLQRRIGFLTIAQVASDVLDEFLNSASAATTPATFDDVYETDRWARRRTIEKLRLAA
jgi:1-deoxy-D-xylulose-5-phosphate reductoisomerase